MNRFFLKEAKETEPYCCECSLVDDAIDTLAYVYTMRESDYASIAIVCNKELTECIIKHIISAYELSIEYLTFDKEDYYDDYGIILTLQDDGFHLSLETILGDDDYKFFDFDYLYIEKNVSKEFIKINTDTEMDIFDITGQC